MNQILNTGLDTNIWWNILKFIILVLIFLRICFKVYTAYNDYMEKKNIKTHIISISIYTVIFIFSFIFLFIAFGPGKNLPVPEEITPIESVKDLPDEKSKEEIEMEAAESKPEVLKRQDSSFTKETQEADDYIKKALENNN